MDVNDEDLEPLMQLNSEEQHVQAGQTIVALNEPVENLYIPITGWTLRARYLDDGRRQIINFQLPGDYFDLMSLVGAPSDHTFSAATDAVAQRKDKHNRTAIDLRTDGRQIVLLLISGLECKDRWEEQLIVTVTPSVKA